MSNDARKFRPSVDLTNDQKQVIEKVAAEYGRSEASVLSAVIGFMADMQPEAWALVLSPLPRQFVPEAVRLFAMDLLRRNGLDEHAVTIEPGKSKESPPDAKPRPSGGRSSKQRAAS